MELNDHANRLHAVLSASSSARWLACPPSAQLCAALPDTVTDYAARTAMLSTLPNSWQICKNRLF